MTEKLIKNGVISDVAIGFDDKGILTGYVVIEYDGAKQAFGGNSLEGQNAAIWLHGVLEVVGVVQISQLVNRPVRVEADNVKIHRLGNFLKDAWFTMDPIDAAPSIEEQLGITEVTATETSEVITDAAGYE